MSPEEKPIPAERPLVTFALFAYNQENYIREAIEGAFSQTYSPLEIILSDDSSTDRTFDIMAEMAAEYHGPHKVVLNKNATNLGIGEHVTTGMRLASGELFVLAAGDDISVPTRCERLADLWIRNGRPYCSIFSGTIEFDENGPLDQTTPLPLDPSSYARPEDVWLHPLAGATQAVSQKTFELFGDLPPDLVNEDSALFFRSFLIGEILTLDEPLVRHRQHATNTGSGGRHSVKTAAQLLVFHERSLSRMRSLLSAMVADLQRSPAASDLLKIGEPARVQAVDRMNGYINRLEKCIGLLRASSFGRTIGAAGMVSGKDPISRHFWKILPQICMPEIYLLVKSLKSKRPAC